MKTTDMKWIVRVEIVTREPSPELFDILKELGIDRYAEYTNKTFTKQEFAELFYFDFKVDGTRIYLYL